MLTKRHNWIPSCRLVLDFDWCPSSSYQEMFILRRDKRTVAREISSSPLSCGQLRLLTEQRMFPRGCESTSTEQSIEWLQNKTFGLSNLLGMIIVLNINWVEIIIIYTWHFICFSFRRFCLPSWTRSSRNSNYWILHRLKHYLFPTFGNGNAHIIEKYAIFT